MVRQKLATGVDADYDGIGVGPGEFEIRAVPAEGVSLPKLEEAIDKEIAAIRGDGAAQTLSADELSRAKTLIKASTIYARDGLEDVARTLGALVMAGLDPDYFNRWPALIDQVTVDDVRKAADATFNPDASVTGTLLPRQTPKSPAPQEGK